jgi:Aldo/keto reductase family
MHRAGELQPPRTCDTIGASYCRRAPQTGAVTGKGAPMDNVRLGKAGLKVSRIALGCMSYGDPTAPGAHTWALDDDEAQPFFHQAVEVGVTFWDTANVYQLGTSEEVVGRAIRRYARQPGSDETPSGPARRTPGRADHPLDTPWLAVPGPRSPRRTAALRASASAGSHGPLRVSRSDMAANRSYRPQFSMPDRARPCGP